jgi:aminoglycoside phosphotransferase family enzyme/predicted kinase
VAASSVSEPKQDQEKVIAFLSEGSAFGQTGQAVDRIDTHAAIIFLIGKRAYKLKRAVRYSFLDFSTIEKRHHILSEEYRLNIRTAPKLYRSLIPVTCDDQGILALKGEGRIVDWLLAMERFDQAALLDHRAEKGELDGALIRRLASEIADLHQKAVVKSGGGHAAMLAIIEGNAGDLEHLSDEIEATETIATLNKATHAALADQQELLDRRARTGFVRHCHGDLHLGNIYLDGDRPVLFDCLEFDEALATIDVFYDLAFLLMDLCHRGLHPFALDLLSAYLDRTEDDEGTKLLPMFLAVRATIRAKIEGFEIETAETIGERSKHRHAAVDYLDLARCLFIEERPRLIAIGGRSGTGKSTIARLLAHQLDWRTWPVVLRSDVMRKHLFDVEPTTKLGADAYSPSSSTHVYRHLRDRAAILLRSGRQVIADATFLDQSERMAIERLAQEAEVPFQGIWLDAPRDALERRISTRRGDASDADVDVLSKQFDRDIGTITWTRIDAGKEPDDVAQSVRGLLST